MTDKEDLHIADMQIKAAYAYAAAAHVHSAGDHAPPQKLARKGLGYSVEALKAHGRDRAERSAIHSGISRMVIDESSSERRAAQSNESHNPGCPE